MTKKARKAIARIMAVLMVFTLLPFQVSADMAMVEASETSESTGGGIKTTRRFRKRMWKKRQVRKMLLRIQKM